MRIALLGYDDDALALVQAACDSGEHTLAAVYDAGAAGAGLPQPPPAHPAAADAWESLLVRDDIDLIVVGTQYATAAFDGGVSGAERRSDQLRKLAAAGIPLVLVQPACETMVGYEVEMIRREGRTVLLPWARGTWHPAHAASAGRLLAGESELGAIEQLEWRCAADDRSRTAVLRRLVRDALAIRQWIGPLRQVTATGPAAGKYDPLSPAPPPVADLSRLQVILRGPGQAPLCWQMGPVHESPGALLTITGAAGVAELRMPEVGDWTLKTPSGEMAFCRADEFTGVLEAVSRLARGEEPGGLWLAACHDLELPSLVDRSLQRGRTVDLASDEATERQNFRGVMAAGGCLALVGSLAVVGLGFALDGLPLPFEHKYLRFVLPGGLLLTLGLFLAGQFLGLLAKDRRANASSE